MKPIGSFERRARERRLKEDLWRCFWVQEHAYDADLDVKQHHSEEAFGWAVEEQHRLMGEAERLGFEGDPVWALERMGAS